MQVGSEGFIELSKTAEDAKSQLENLVGVKFEPLTKQIRETEIELDSLKEQGLENTEQYKDLIQEAANLTKELKNQREEIKSLASDSFALDATVDIIQQITAAFQLYQGVTALVGVQSEELQETMIKLQSLLNISNGLQQIQNFLRGQSAAFVAAPHTADSGVIYRLCSLRAMRFTGARFQRVGR
jgi:molecular chaperone GrpE (heat shock protein)